MHKNATQKLKSLILRIEIPLPVGLLILLRSLVKR